MRSVCLFLSALFATTTLLFAQTGSPTESDEAYLRTINTRAQKIVSNLGLTDSAKFYRVLSVIANQYRQLAGIHAKRDGAIKTIKAQTTDKTISEAGLKGAQDEATVSIAALHTDFLKQLSADLSPEQVIMVKDGLTYNVVNVTYAGYMDMIPTLTTVQKQQIRAWLEEARESAMDAESSEKKHAWFGKYKGRINNYLSAAGYNLQKERKEWEARIKAREEKKEAAMN